ncbi:MAG: thioredoxin [Candidatus Shikimatogenerans sp. JK-2022]|nr:thioredoxin [Candidatus Shikimatogenerans bostrichidophilus]
MKIINNIDIIKKKIKKNKISMIDFWANWCNPCLYINPIIEYIHKKYKNKIFIYKINIEKYENITVEYNIQSIPTIIFFSYGKEIYRHIGMINKSKLIKICNKLIKD